MTAKKAWNILKDTFKEFGEDNVLRLSAALAYYAIFSMGPLLIITVGLAGLAFGHETVPQEIDRQLSGVLGQEATRTIDSMMSAQRHSTSVVTAVIGMVVLLFGAMGVFGQLQDALNTIWEVKAKPGAGIWSFVRARLLSLGMVFGTGFLLLVSMAFTTFLSAMGGALGSRMASSERLIGTTDFVISFGGISLLFALIFKYVPDVKVPFRKVLAGAVGTALLFTLGKYLLALYLGRATTTSSYGAAGSVVVILLWVYYASVILFFGAEFTQVYTKATSGQVATAEHAAQVTEK